MLDGNLFVNGFLFDLFFKNIVEDLVKVLQYYVNIFDLLIKVCNGYVNIYFVVKEFCCSKED